MGKTLNRGAHARNRIRTAASLEIGGVEFDFPGLIAAAASARRNPWSIARIDTLCRDSFPDSAWARCR